jgi:hypothetical protein
MINQKANPLLVKTEQAVRAKLKPDQAKAFQKIVTAGLRILDSEQTHQMIAGQLKQQAEPTEIAGSGVAKLMGVMINQSKGTMPMKAGIPAATVLLLEALDRLEELGKIEITNDTLAAAMQSMSSALMQLFGVTPDKLSAMMKAKQGGQPQPEAPPEQAPAAPAGPQPLIGAPA